jgi:4-hydroxy-2-oxoheptanedioate aldolase
VQKNRIKERIRRGEAAVGAFCNIPSPTVVEMVGLLGLDFVILDGEHTTMGPETAENLYRAAELRGLTAITRVGENTPQVIQKFMDAGSMGVLMPLVSTKEEAQRVVNAVKYPPLGKRGLAGVRAASFGFAGPLGDYVKTANEETLVAVQVETLEGVKNYKDILSVENIDVVFFGPSDLSSSMGYPGQTRHPEVLALIERLGREAMAAGKAAGTIARDLEDYKRWRERGFQFLCTGVANFLARGLQEHLQEIRDYEKSRR